MTTYTVPNENSPTYTGINRGDYIAGSGGIFDSGKFDSIKFDNLTDFSRYTIQSKNINSYTNETKN